MGRRGPQPGTTGRSPAEVAAIAATARELRQRVSLVVAAHYGITPTSAVRVIARARAKGADIPYDYGYTDPTGTWQQGHLAPGRARSIYAHGTTSRYRQGCKCGRCTAARAAYHRNYRAAHRPPSPEAAAPQAPTQAAPVAPRSLAAALRVPPTAARTPPAGPHITLRCTTCGTTTSTVWVLAGHTLDAHDRIPTRTERTPTTPTEQEVAV